MKHLKLFENFNTNIDLDIDEIKSTLNDIFLELSDLDCDIDIKIKSNFVEVYCSNINSIDILASITTFETTIEYMIENEFEFKRIDSVYKKEGRNVLHEVRIRPVYDITKPHLQVEVEDRFYNGDLTSTFEFWKDRFETYYKSEVVQLKIVFQKN